MIKIAALIYVIAVTKSNVSSKRFSITFGLSFIYIVYKIHDIGCWKYKLKNKWIPILCYKPGLGSLQWMRNNAKHEYHRKTTILTHQKIAETKEKFVIMGAPKLYFNSNFNYTIYDARIIKHIFQDTFRNYAKGSSIHDPLEELFGEGIHTADAKQWEFHRKITSRMFSMRNLKRHIFGCAIRNTAILLDKMEDLSGEQYENELDLYQLFGRFTLQSFIEIAFGEQLSIVESYPDDNALCSSFDRLVRLCEERMADPLWKMKRYFGIGQREGIDIPHDTKVLNAFCYRIISDRNRQKRIINEDETELHDLLSLFLKHSGIKQRQLTNQLIRDITMNIVIGARDTTRILLSWFFYEVTKDENADILENIYKEIDAYKHHELIYGDCTPYLGGGMRDGFVNQENAGLTPRCDDMNDHRKYQYLEAVICEILRLYPPVVFVQRYANRDNIQIPYTTFDGKDRRLRIDKGDGVCVYTPSYLRLPQIWGTDGRDPNKINVDNFYSHGVNSYSTFTYPVFNIHSRTCLGKTAALLQTKCILISILRKYRIEPMEDPVVTHVLAPLYVMKEGFKVKISPRSNNV